MSLTDTLNYYVDNGFMTSSQRAEILAQRLNFDAQRTMIESTYKEEAVAFAQGVLFHGPDLGNVTDQVQAMFPGGVMYAEFPVALVQPVDI